MANNCNSAKCYHELCDNCKSAIIEMRENGKKIAIMDGERKKNGKFECMDGDSNGTSIIKLCNEFMREQYCNKIH